LPLQKAHILLYTAAASSWSDRPDQMHQFKQFLSPKRGPSGGHDVERVVGNEVGPAPRNGAQTASTVMEPGPVLAPVLATHDQIEFLAEQRMVRVRHPKRSTFNVTMRRS
jgi:hypothetical protein